MLTPNSAVMAAKDVDTEDFDAISDGGESHSVGSVDEAALEAAGYSQGASCDAVRSFLRKRKAQHAKRSFTNRFVRRFCAAPTFWLCFSQPS